VQGTSFGVVYSRHLPETEDIGNMNRLIGLTIATLVLGLISVATSSLAQQTQKPNANAVKNLVPATPQSIASGKALFAKNCRFCHGEDAKGNGPQAPEGTHPPDLTDDKWDHGSSDEEIFAVIKDGIGPKYDMKGNNSKMTPQEMWNIVNYLRSIGPSRAQ
jgi:mono/diheme cytochrome c family protein